MRINTVRKPKKKPPTLTAYLQSVIDLAPAYGGRIVRAKSGDWMFADQSQFFSDQTIRKLVQLGKATPTKSDIRRGARVLREVVIDNKIGGT